MFTLLALHGSGRDETDLMDYCRQIAPLASMVAPRGAFPEGCGFTFFKRRADRSIQDAEVVALAKQWLFAEAQLQLPVSEQIVVVGYSSGAIFAEAMLSVTPQLFAGAILMRPQPLSSEFAFSDMSAKPILILAGRHDERRRPQDAFDVAKQFKAANAQVELHMLNSGHDWAPQDEDITLSRRWLRAVWNC